MTIVPNFDIVQQTKTHVIIHVYVPHVRFNVNDIQLSYTHHNTTMHLYCPPIYLLVLNFAPYQFRTTTTTTSNNDDGECDDNDDHEVDLEVNTVDDSDTSHKNNGNHRTGGESGCNTTTTTTTTTSATYSPTVRNGMIRLELEKYIPYHSSSSSSSLALLGDESDYWWDNLDLIGKLMTQQPLSSLSSSSVLVSSSSSSSSLLAAASKTPTVTTQHNWLREIIHQEEEAEGDGDANQEEVGTNQQQQQQSPQQQQQDNIPPTTPTTTADVLSHNNNNNNNTQTYYSGTYGFHRMFANIYTDLQRENSIIYQMLECPWTTTTSTTTTSTIAPNTNDDDVVLPITTKSTCTSSIQQQQQQRQQERIASYEMKKFNIERYIQDIDIIADSGSDYLYDYAMQMIPHWTKMKQNQNQNHNDDRSNATTATTATTTATAATTTIDNNTDNDHDTNNNNTTVTTMNEDHFFTKAERHLLMSIPYPLLDDPIILHPPRTEKNTDGVVPPSGQQSQHQPQQYHQQVALCIGLIDVLYAYVYDHMMTIDSEPTVESSWTISTISISLSWLYDWLPDQITDDDDDDDENNVHCTQSSNDHHHHPTDNHHKATNDDGPDPTHSTTTTTTTTTTPASSPLLNDMVLSVLQSLTRRSLVYPYIRNFSLCIHIWEQVVLILHHPDCIRVILRCLLQTRNILNHSELYYLGNKLYIDPYLLWIQQYSDTNYLQHQLLRPIGNCIQRHIRGTANLDRLKASLGLQLLEIEADFYKDDDDDDNECDGGSNDGDSSVSDSDVDSSDGDGDDDDDDGSDSSENTESSSSDESYGNVDVAEKIGEMVDEDEKVEVPVELLDVVVDVNDMDGTTTALERLELRPTTTTATTKNPSSVAIRRDDLFNICSQWEALTTTSTTATDVETVSTLIQEVEQNTSNEAV